MSIYNQQLPPGLYGFVAGQQAGQEQEAHDLRRQMGVMQILQAQAAMQKQKREEALLAEKQKALTGLIGAAQPRPLGQQALAEGAAQGDVGPTVTNAARLDAMQQNPTRQGYTPIPLQNLSAAAASGVNIDPFLKLNEAARPDVLTVDTGDEIRLIDKRTMKIVERVSKKGAPGSVPFEASDLTPDAFRRHTLDRATAGAARTVTNVNAFTPASEEAQRDFIKSTRQTYDALKHAPVALDSINKAKELIPQAKGFMGPAGETLLDAAKFLNNRMGMSINTEGVSSAEELRTRIFFNIMDNLKKMDAQPSQMQQQIMMESLGKLGTDPNALPRVLDAFSDVIRGKVDLHNKEVQGAITRGVKFPYDPVINLPPPSGPKKDEMKEKPPAAQHRGKVIEDSNGKRYKSDGMTWKPL